MFDIKRHKNLINGIGVGTIKARPIGSLLSID